MDRHPAWKPSDHSAVFYYDPDRVWEDVQAVYGAVIALACIIFSVFAASPPAVADSSLSAVNIVWSYVAELIFNLLVLVGAIKASDRIVKEMMGL